jgi:hypothetical protein
LFAFSPNWEFQPESYLSEFPVYLTSDGRQGVPDTLEGVAGAIVDLGGSQGLQWQS